MQNVDSQEETPAKKSHVSASVNEEDTGANVDVSAAELGTDAGDEEDELFGDFQFRSFKTQQLVDENYELINIKDPEKPRDLIVKDYYPEEKVTRDAVELVPINSEELAEQERAKRAREKARER